MPTLNLSCSAVIAELEAKLHAAALPQITAASVTHISGCSHCRVRLMRLIRAAAPNDDHGLAQPAACQAQLAAFLEVERFDMARAVATYPSLWRHIWSCADCMENYLVARALLVAEAAGQLPPLKLAQHRSPPASGLDPTHIVLTQRTLQMALPRKSASSAQHSSADSHVVFTDTLQQARKLTIAVRQQSTESWSMQVTIDPPLVGTLLLAVGDEHFAAPLPPTGSAIIDELPARLFSDPDAPAFKISIVPTRAPSV